MTQFSRMLAVALGFCWLAISGIGMPAPAFARGAPDSFADLADKTLPAVVNVSTTQNITPDQQSQDLEELFREFLDRDQGQEPQQRKATSLGSGFIVDPSGYVVTNNHVIENADTVEILLHDGRKLPAKIIGRDEKTDLALLKVESDMPLPSVNWGDSEELRIGDWVLAIGNPFGLGGTVTAGIVSARQRDINSGPYDDYIQTDASINRGNSGGPMFNMEGQVVGINTAIFSPSGGSIGIGFAIPSNLARPIIDQIRQYGHPKRGWLGVRIQTVSDELAEGLRMPEPKGALIASVTKDGPAEKAGIKQGDVVLAFDGKEVTAMRGLPRIVAETPAGKTVDVDIWRGGKQETVSVIVGELTEEAEAKTMTASMEAPAPAQKGDLVEVIGLTLQPLSDELRAKFEIPSGAKGVVITEVAPDGPGAARDLKPGDLIAEVDQKAVETTQDVADRVQAAQDNGYRVVTLLINRKGEFQWVALSLKK